MNGEEFRREVSNLLTKQVTLQELTNKKLDVLCECTASKDDHKRLERKVEKILERVIVIGVIVSAIAAAVGVAF